MPTPEWTNALYYGDNLEILREHVPDESVDLVYLDPPFNSNASYNVLFREQSGEGSPAAGGRSSAQTVTVRRAAVNTGLPERRVKICICKGVVGIIRGSEAGEKARPVLVIQ